MFYTVYKITNNINKKYYIGKHQTKDLNDGYMGSGKLLKRAIKKYGLDNFSKEILHVFQTEQEMNDKEKELVILQEMCYNLCEGGKGGFGYINDMDNPLSLQIKRVQAKANFGPTNSNNGKIYGKINIANAHKLGKVKYDTFTGRKHTEETKRKMSIAAKKRIAKRQEITP